MRSGGDEKRVVNIGEELGLIYDDNYVLPSITNNEDSIPFLRRRKKRQKSSMQDSSTLSLSATKPASPRSFDICNSIQFGLFNTNNISNVPNKSINKNSMSMSMSMSQDKDKDISYIRYLSIFDIKMMI